MKRQRVSSSMTAAAVFLFFTALTADLQPYASACVWDRAGERQLLSRRQGAACLVMMWALESAILKSHEVPPER